MQKGTRAIIFRKKLYYYRIARDEKGKHRPMKYRVDEMIVRLRGYKDMNMLVKGIPYVFKPVLIGIIPRKILNGLSDQFIK